MAEEKINKGYLNANKYKKNEKQPDFKGKVKVDVDFIKELANSAKTGAAEIHISGWSGVSKQDQMPYIYISVEPKAYAPQGAKFKSLDAPKVPVVAVVQPAAAPAPAAENGFDDILDGLV